MTIGQWRFDQEGIDWQELSILFRIAPLADKSAEHLRLVFGNSQFKCFVLDAGKLVGAGRALADGRDCCYLCDIVVHPDYQGRGLGKAVVAQLTALCAGHSKIILYENPGKEGFYRKCGFPPDADRHGLVSG
ncbi:MAG: GNAT family N-acetyltransferase [Pseudomonadota bacterium]|nr:GNAT family N-acetyltransferase [Pseudomonadota bacterium]